MKSFLLHHHHHHHHHHCRSLSFMTAFITPISLHTTTSRRLIKTNNIYTSVVKRPRHQYRPSTTVTTIKMSTSTSSKSPSRPIVVTDVLDTLVRDPFFNGMAHYFNFDSMDKFIDAKTPTIWVDFETGKISEQDLAQNFFKDGTPIDLPRFKQFLLQSYQLLPGVHHMLTCLRDANIDVHVCSNYPVWAQLIEEAVGLEKNYGVQWTFVSANYGVRKPDKKVFEIVAKLVGDVDFASCIFLDDRQANCDAATDIGMHAIKYVNTQDCQQQLKTILSSKFQLSIDF